MTVQVLIIESERGWGQRLDETKYFETRAEAEKFCDEYNKRNTDSVAPDWYMAAHIGEESVATKMLELSGTIKRVARQ